MEYKTLCTFLGKNYKANLINDSVLLRLCVHFWKKIINDSVSNQRLGWHLGKKIINDPGPLFDTLEYFWGMMCRKCQLAGETFEVQLTPPNANAALYASDMSNTIEGGIDIDFLVVVTLSIDY